MRVISLTLLLATIVPILALADPAITTRSTTMRAAPSPKARPVQKVPMDAEIDLNYCARNWCYVSWRNRFGYLPVNTVAALPPRRRIYVMPPPPIYPLAIGGRVTGVPDMGPRFLPPGRWPTLVTSITPIGRYIRFAAEFEYPANGFAVGRISL